MKKCVFTGMVIFLSMFYSFGQSAKEKGLSSINENVVKGQLEFLASDWTEGRETGAKGAYMAADYIASMFKVYGIKPFGDVEMQMPSRRMMRPGPGFRPKMDTTFFQNFSLIKYTPGNDNSLDVISYGNGSERAVHFNYQTDFSVNSGSVGLSAKALVVFAGYGLTNEDKNYDDFKNLDVNGKIVLLINGFPGHKDTTSEAYKKFRPVRPSSPFRRSRGNRFENLIEKGAVAVIQATYVAPPTSWDQKDVYPAKGNYYEADAPLGSYYDYRMVMPGSGSSPNFPSFAVTQSVLDAIIDGTGLNIEEFEEYVQKNMKPASRVLTGKAVSFNTSVNTEVVKVRNVVGYIEGKNKDEYIVVGGHYDHLGKFDGWTWNGADDNASGTVGVMTIAKAFMETGVKPEKSVVFAAWTAEEKGLYGSQYFVKDAKDKGMNVLFNLNYDMISRNEDDDSLGVTATMNYTQAYQGLKDLTVKGLEDYNINLDVTYRASERPGGGSDHASFSAEDIPIIYFEAAMHPDYHQPSDEVSKINWKKTTDIIRIGFLNMWELANSDQYLQKSEVEED
ncbi:MAG: M20/M25/M40 family metallo-hydrolase [Prolixibacteraceae bacterium]|nr:M20/M25/M40 family metallo-hydrolase [Prolixibacteraceae bacterium]MBN2773971.1 M20/M25/M40 family metallo-hydrolase [Prolixibacteraceae bacterium]